MAVEQATNRFCIITPDTRSDDQYGLFSEAVWICLEKFGLLDYEVLDWRTYRAKAPGGPGHLAIITAPMARHLSVSDLEWFEERGGPVFVEGPWSSSLDTWFGVTIHRQGPARSSARVMVDDERLRALLTDRLTGIKGPSNSGAFTGLDSIRIRDRTRVERRQSTARSRFEGVNLRALHPSWNIRETSLDLCADVAALLRWRDESDAEARGVLLIRKGRIMATTFEACSYLAQDYTAPYDHHHYSFSDDRYTIELMLVRQWLDALMESAGRASSGWASLRMAPWPHGKQYGLCVRHDVDRPARDPQIARLLSVEAETGVGVSCYFLEQTAESDTIDRFQRNGAEIAYHAAHLEPTGEAELAAVQRHARDRISGMTVHGGTRFYGWRGAANWEWAALRGFEYAENLSSMRYLPARAFKLTADNGIEPYPFVCLPHHASFDRNLQTTFFAELVPSIQAMARNQMAVILLNHPDIHVQDLCTLLREFCPPDYVGLSALEMARWWKKTHVRSEFSYRVASVSDDAVELVLESRSPIEGLTFELPIEPAPVVCAINGRSVSEDHQRPFDQSALGDRGVRVWVDVPEGISSLRLAWSRSRADATALQASGTARHSSGVASIDREAPSLARVTDTLQQHILDWFARQNNGDVTAGNLITAGFNSVKVPKRFAQLMGPHSDWLEGLARPGILDVGCGFGGIALYLAARYPTAAVTATDVSDRFYRAGKDAAIEVGLRNVTFASQNVLDLDYEEQFDLVLLSNILCYVVTHDQLQRACRNAWRALRPGGCLVIHTAHLWSIREPFTSIPGLQFLPRAGRDLLARKTGRRSTMRDIRLPSWRELRRILTHLGACQIDHRPRGALALLRAKHLTAWATK